MADTDKNTFTMVELIVVIVIIRTAMELVGSGVKLVGENEVVSSDGSRTSVVGGLDRGSKAFTQSFTKHYPQIAEKALVFAQLRNWIDMLICAAHIQREDFYGKSGWTMKLFGSEEKFPLERFIEPKEVEPVVGIRVIGRTILTPVGGGIVIDAERALDEAKGDSERKIVERQKNKLHSTCRTACGGGTCDKSICFIVLSAFF
jgi:hypothetical protein